MTRFMRLAHCHTCIGVTSISTSKILPNNCLQLLADLKVLTLNQMDNAVLHLILTLSLGLHSQSWLKYFIEFKSGGVEFLVRKTVLYLLTS